MTRPVTSSRPEEVGHDGEDHEEGHHPERQWSDIGDEGLEVLQARVIATRESHPKRKAQPTMNAPRGENAFLGERVRPPLFGKDRRAQ